MNYWQPHTASEFAHIGYTTEDPHMTSSKGQPNITGRRSPTMYWYHTTKSYLLRIESNKLPKAATQYSCMTSDYLWNL